MRRDGGSFQLVDLDGGIIEILFKGYLVAEMSTYLQELEARVQKGNDVRLLYNTLDMTGFAPPFPMAHIAPFRAWMGKVTKIAVVHTMTSVGLAIATVRLASGANLKGFSTREDGFTWANDRTGV